jgi:hypothetical protein
MEEEIEKMNTPIEENYYPIHEACKTNNIIAVKHLLPHVDVNICSPIGTPLIIACKDNYSELIDLLLRSTRVDPNVKDKDGNIFLHYLVQHPDADNLDTFGSFMIHKNNDGYTPLDILKSFELLTIDIVEGLPPAYFFDGHGCDTGILTKVPDNCLYVTIALCGNNITTGQVKPFYSIDPDLLLNPIKHKNAIEKHMKLPIQIYNPGDTYSDVMYSTPLFFKVSKHKTPDVIETLVLKSGLQNVYLKSYDIFSVKNSDIKQKVFQYSILPRIEDVPDISSEEKIEEKWELNFRQSELFEHYEGIYYNIACRSACGEILKPYVALRRQDSITRRITNGSIKTMKQLIEIDKPTLYEWIDNPGIVFDAPRDELLRILDIPDEKKDLLVPHKFIGGKRKLKRKSKKLKRKSTKMKR